MNDRQTEILYTIALTQIPLIGSVIANKLIDRCGSAEQVFKEPSNHLSRIDHVSTAIVDSIVSTKSIALNIARQELEYIDKKKVTVFLKKDKTFPARLTSCIDAPVILFGEGNLDLNPKHSVAIVGTRRLTEYGSQITKKIVKELSSYKEIQIISGLATGIDTVAHQASIQNSLSTVGILGHGLQTLYPAGNRKLALKMRENGGIITEFTSNIIGDAYNFPKRNRIIAGMADAILVVEAYERGGALITANIGFSYNRDIFTIPGRIGDKASEGCNNLIKYNKAALITSGEDILKSMMWDDNSRKNTEKGKQKKLLFDLSQEEQLIVDALQTKNGLNIDELTTVTNLNISTLTMTLLTLEFKNIINCLPGKRYFLI
ncbi:MAG: DNA-processing protein DprA [Bacteroidales bacterium]|jgi:DNA processing protein|nr:DNA-processing protein DprA [Bacteroidales bacterium]